MVTKKPPWPPPKCWVQGGVKGAITAEIPPNKAGWWTNNRAVAGAKKKKRESRAARCPPKKKPGSGAAYKLAI